MADSFASAIGWLHGEIHLAPLRLNLKSLKMSTPVIGFWSFKNSIIVKNIYNSTNGEFHHYFRNIHPGSLTARPLKMMAKGDNPTFLLGLGFGLIFRGKLALKLPGSIY